MNESARCRSEALDMGMLEDTHPDHDFYQLFSEPADVGFSGLARSRTWVIGSHRDHGTCLYDPFQLQSLLSTAFQKHVQANVPDFLVASRTEIQMEAFDRARRKGTSYQLGQVDMQYLLNERENNCRQALDAKYVSRYKQLPWENPNLVYYLGDSETYCTWSACSSKIPTYRVGARSAVYWLPSQRRWLTAKERLCSIGYPCIPEIADAMKVPTMGATDVQRAADICGNSMHFTTCGIMQLIALACFGPKDVSPDFSSSMLMSP
eukprot:s213_g5.t1